MACGRRTAWIAVGFVVGSLGLELDVDPPRWSLLKVVEKSLSATAGVVRGVGDTLAVGTGGTIRMLGGGMQHVGGGIEGLSDAVEGEKSRTDDDESSRELSDGLRLVASRPIRVVGKMMRALGDTTNFIGDTTEKVAAEAIGILPDTVRVVESSVRSFRAKIGDGDDEAALAAELAAQTTRRQTGLQLRRLEEGIQEHSGLAASVSDSNRHYHECNTTLEPGSSSCVLNNSLTREDLPAFGSQRAAKSMNLAGFRRPLGNKLHSHLSHRLGLRLGGKIENVLGMSSLHGHGLQSHLLFVLATVALCARSGVQQYKPPLIATFHICTAHVVCSLP